MYVRRNERQGIRVLHIDDINVDARYRRHGLAQRLMSLEELARREQRPFLKLAVTVANTPAVTLYRRLGYQEQQHRFVTYDPATSALRPPESSPISRCALWGGDQHGKCIRSFYRMEMRASDPAVADMLVAYYPRGAGGVGVPRACTLRYAIELRGQQIGYGDAYRRGTRWNLRLNLTPAFWGTEDLERQAIQLLTSAVTRLLLQVLNQRSLSMSAAVRPISTRSVPARMRSRASWASACRGTSAWLW